MYKRELWRNFKSGKIYVNRITQEVRDRRIVQTTSYLLVEKFPGMMKALKPLTQKFNWFKDLKYDKFTKAHHNSWLKTINQRNVTRRKNRHSRTKNGDDSRLGIWNNGRHMKLGTWNMAPHHKCWEKYNWLRILYTRKLRIKNNIEYFFRQTTTTRLHHHQQTNVINVF